jgi:hypothetical protein
LEIREAGAEFMLIPFIFTSTLRIVPSKRNGRLFHDNLVEGSRRSG